jgi:hypothetical protein
MATWNFSRFTKSHNSGVALLDACSYHGSRFNQILAPNSTVDYLRQLDGNLFHKAYRSGS